jgi:hypothetical protein
VLSWHATLVTADFNMSHVRIATQEIFLTMLTLIHTLKWNATPAHKCFEPFQ